MSAPVPVIAIDGPSGSGKGAVAARLAAGLGYHLLDSGALYRLTALAARRSGADTDDAEAVAALAADLPIIFRQDVSGSTRILLDGDDVTDAIRAEECGMLASKLASYPAVRTALLARQRAFRQAPGLVADGRDMGTVVFRDAELKIFLTASAEERAERRYKQLIEKGISVSLPHLLADIRDRDRRDAERSTAPLIKAADALELDTTGVDLETVMQKVWSLARERGLVTE